MSGINCGIFPVIASPAEASTLALLAENENLLIEIGDTETIISNQLINIANVTQPNAEALNTSLNAIIQTNTTYQGTGMGQVEHIYTDGAIASVSTPTYIQTLELNSLGTFILTYAFIVNTNTLNGGVTPLTSVIVYFDLEGVSLTGNPIVFYPQSARTGKQNFDIAVSGTFPFYCNAYSPASTLRMYVNIYPENSAYGTTCSQRMLSCVNVSPYRE